MVENIVDFAEIMMPEIIWHRGIIDRIQVSVEIILIWMDVNALIAARFCKIGLSEIGLLMVINTFSKKSALNVEKEPLAKNMFPLER